MPPHEHSHAPVVAPMHRALHTLSGLYFPRTFHRRTHPPHAHVSHTEKVFPRSSSPKTPSGVSRMKPMRRWYLRAEDRTERALVHALHLPTNRATFVSPRWG